MNNENNHNDIKKQFSELIAALKEIKEVDLTNDCITYVEDIINGCSHYVDRVTQMESAICTAKFVMEPDDYRTYISNLDKSRKIAHDGVVVNMAILNKYCRLADVEPIYKGDLDNRYEVAEFAMVIVKAYFQDRKL